MEPAFHIEQECGCSLSIYPNEGTTIADFGVLGDKAPGIAWATCRTHAAGPKLLAALERLEKTMREQLSALIDTQKIDANETRVAFEQARAAIEEARK